MHRSYADDVIVKSIGDKVVLSTDESKHISKVLRIRPGEKIEVCDGAGRAYVSNVLSVESQVEVGIISEIDNNEPLKKVVLFQSLSKGTKMDLVIQKAVELGVSEIVPVETEFSVVKVKEESSKIIRWNRIAIEAVKQCKRSVVPKVYEPVKFSKAIEMMKGYDLSVIAYECDRENTYESLFKDEINSVGIMIGPEGGFSPSEIEIAKNDGVKTITLGKRILRTETAAIALLAVTMFKLHELD